MNMFYNEYVLCAYARHQCVMHVVFYRRESSEGTAFEMNLGLLSSLSDQLQFAHWYNQKTKCSLTTAVL